MVESLNWSIVMNRSSDEKCTHTLSDLKLSQYLKLVKLPSDVSSFSWSKLPTFQGPYLSPSSGPDQILTSMFLERPSFLTN
jgi:hypothetical protein